MNNAILERMAKLREQRNLIRAIHDYHLNGGTVAGGVSTALTEVGPYIGSIEENHILPYLRKRSILLSDKGKAIDTIVEGSPEFKDRAFKIASLYKSCKDAGFIEPLIVDVPSVELGKTNPAHLGIAITDSGSDLLNWLGFTTAVFKKNGIITGIALSGIGWITIHILVLVYQLWMYGNLF